MVFGDTLEVPQLGTFTYEDTVDLEVTGTADAPTLLVTDSDVKIHGSIPFPVDLLNTFEKDVALPVVPGAERC